MATGSADHLIDRPFYFIVVLWGERFRNYFLDICLPSLLSPGNLPALGATRSKFLIWTRPQDWTAIASAPIFRLLEQYVEPVFSEIPACPADVQACIHMGIGHRRGLEMAYEAKAYPFVLQPDSLFSDGMLRRLRELAASGVQLALVPALRFAEEPLFQNLAKFGVVPHGRNGVAQPIALTGRQLAQAALSSMHIETATYEWSAPYFHSNPSAAWWRVPGEDGIIVHCFPWAALLLDFDAVASHDLSTFDNWTIDGDYIYNNIGNIKRIHLVLDSDEMFLASWTPAADRACYYDLTPQPALQGALTSNFVRKKRFRRWFYSESIDPLRRSIFFATVRWHSAPLSAKWQTTERRALETLLSCVAPPPLAQRFAQLSFDEKVAAPALAYRFAFSLLATLTDWGDDSIQFLRRRCYQLLRIRHLWRRPYAICRLLWTNRGTIMRQIAKILRGDRTARQRASLRVHQAFNQLLGRPMV